MTQFATKHSGLASDEARALLQRYGPNSLPEKPPTPLWQRLLRQFRSPLIYILLFALGVDTGIWFSEGASGLPVESIAIAIILLLNASLRVYQESKSEAVLGLRDEIGFTLLQNGIPLIVTIYRKADNAFEMGTKVKDSLRAKLQYQ